MREFNPRYAESKDTMPAKFRNLNADIYGKLWESLEDGELCPDSVVKESLTVQTESKREVERSIRLYNLDLILAIGYCIRSPRGGQFRQWATIHLHEYLIKGFVMEDERLKNPGGWDYFDELLSRQGPTVPTPLMTETERNRRAVNAIEVLSIRKYF